MSETKIFSTTLPENVRPGEVILVLKDKGAPTLIFPAAVNPFGGPAVSESDIVFMAQPMSEEKKQSNLVAFKKDGKYYILDRKNKKEPEVMEVVKADEGPGEEL